MQLQCSLDFHSILQAYDWGEDEEHFYITMEQMNQPEYLKAKIDEDMNQISKELKLQAYMLDIFEGLRYLHQNGIIHADIKLENILANKTPGQPLKQLKLCDFGLS